MPESLTRKKTPPTTARVADFKSEWWPDLFRNGGRLQIGIPAGFTSVSLGLSWVAREGPRHRHERDAAQAGLNEAAGREFRRLWGLRAPQACPMYGKVAGVCGRLR
jgi:hypothetical protein